MNDANANAREGDTLKFAKRMTRGITLLYVAFKQALCFIGPDVDYHCILHRAVVNVVILFLIYAITGRRYSGRRLAALVPMAMALPEIAFVLIEGGGWLLFVHLIGSALLGLLFLDFKGLVISMAVNYAALLCCEYYLQTSGGGGLTVRNEVSEFTELILIYAVILFVCRQFSRTLTRFRDTSEVFGTFMETTPEFLVVIDKGARVANISRSFAEWLGLSAAEYAQKRAFLDLCVKSGIMPAIHGIMEQEGMVEQMLEVGTGGAKKAHFMLRSFPMGGSGMARTFELTDVTTMVEAKRLAEDADRQKSSFLANMSHEIRTPMNAIVGTMDLMLTTPLSEKQLTYASTVKNSAMSLLSIVNDILDISKLSAGKMEIVAAPFDAGSFINDTLNIINIKTLPAGITLTATISKDLPPNINGDEVRIKQCLLNVMNNAVKFTRQGCVSLSVSCEHVQNGLRLNFAVKDTGIGIKKADMERLFNTFVRVDTKKNRAIDGTGLGLAITKNLVEMMGGEISVLSVYGKGTTFSFYVICEGAHYGRIADLRNPEGYRVLACEPDRYHADSLCTMLGDLGVRHDVCRDTGAFRERLAYVGEYTHVLCDTSSAQIAVDAGLKSVNIAVMREARDTSGDMPSLVKPLLITALARHLGGASAAADYASRGDAASKVRLGAFQTKGARVLLVDDNPVNLTVAEEMLRKYGIEVITATDGREGLHKIQRGDFDAAFFDHMMPVMDGVEAVEAIRALGGRYETIPIVALTANAVFGAKKMMLESGMTAFLSKPIIIKELHEVLLEILPAEKIVT